MLKNQKLQENILTPTTKAADHDEPVTPEEVLLLPQLSILALILMNIVEQKREILCICACVRTMLNSF